MKKTKKKKLKRKVIKSKVKKTKKKKVVKKVKKTFKNKAIKKSTSTKRKADIFARISNELIEKGRKRGFITYDEILKTFPDIENNIFF
ncbi:MAG: RNA polymerase sigma factor region1.1 domain-containing protein, partial [Patescibacteria group bacterium]